MKKIIFMLPTIGFGGAEKVYIEVAAALSNLNNYEVELLYLTKVKKERPLPEGLKSKCLNVSSTKAGFFKTLKYLKEKKPDCVFSSQTHLNIMMIFMKKVYSLPFKLYVRQTYNLSNIKKYNFIKRKLYLLFHRSYKYADGVIFQTKFMYKDFISTIKLSNCYIISNPVNIERMSKLALEYNPEFIKEKKQFRHYIFIGRLTKIKNVDYLINSFSRYTKKECAKLLIMGDGPEKENLIRLIEKLNLQKNIYLINAQKNPFPYLKHCDALLLCSKSEGFPNVVLEALGLNTPVFVRKHIGGTEEVLYNLKLSEYYMDELNFNVIEKKLKYYPDKLDKATSDYYGIDNIVQKYINLIDNKE